MTSRFYDVIVVGRSLGTLAAATLLARRDFSVLLIGHGQRPPSYRFEGIRLKRRTFTLLFGSSPVYKRMLHDLAQSPSFRRRLLTLDPMFAMRAPGCTLEVPPEPAAFAAEIEREFPEIRQIVDELYTRVGDANAAIDAAFERDLVWPPGNFWERFETGRVASRLPLAESENVEDLLGKFPPGHPYRDLVVWPARFCCDLSSETGHLPPLALARLHGSWTRGLYALAGGEDELEDFLLERFRAHGGLCALDDRVSELVVERGRIQGVLLSGEEEPFGTDYVVTNLTGEMVAELSGGAGLTKVAERQWPRVEAGTGRFVVSLLVRQVGLPERLPRETLLISSDPDSPRHPVLRLQRLPSETEAAELLVAEMILPRYGPLDLLEAREAVMGTLREHFPFIDEHVIVVDSPHDGLPLYDFRTGSRREWDRIHVPETSNQAEEMAWQWLIIFY